MPLRLCRREFLSGFLRKHSSELRSGELPKDMYQNYIFDLYGTLVDIRTDEEKEEVWEKLSLFYGYYGAYYEAGELKDWYKKLVEKQTGNRAEKEERTKGYAGISCEAYPEIQIEKVFLKLFELEGISADEGLSINAGQFFRLLSTEYIRLYPGAMKMLRNIKENGGKIYLLSNAQRIFTAFEMKYLKLTDYFDGILLSSDYGVKKPEKRFFELLLESYQLKPEESIMTGNDELCDIWGAQQAGMDTCYIHSSISPEYTGLVKPVYRVMEPDFEKVYSLITGKKMR